MKVKTGNQQGKLNKTQTRLFEKINKITKPLAVYLKKPQYTALVTNVRIERGYITTYPMDIKG